MAFGVWCPETRSWLETPFGQIQEYPSIPEAAEQARQMPPEDGETYVVRELPVE